MTATALVAAQQHGPGGAAHLLLLAGVVVAALVALGVSRWRRRRDAKLAEHQRVADDRPAETGRPTKEK